MAAPAPVLWSVLRDAPSALLRTMPHALPLPFHRFARCEVDLNPRAAGVEKEQLPEATRVTVLRQPPQVVFHSARLELGHIGRRVRAPESNMIEHAAAFRN